MVRKLKSPLVFVLAVAVLAVTAWGAAKLVDPDVIRALPLDERFPQFGGLEAEESAALLAWGDFMATRYTYPTGVFDQRWLLELAADRTPFIDQAQSLNLFIPADVDKWDLMMLHFRAGELGIKSLYYLRSKSVQRAGFAGGVEADNTPDLKQIELAATTDYDECLACQ